SVVFYFPLHLLHHCAILSFYTSVHTAIYTLSLHDALPILQLTKGRSLLGMPIQRTFHKQRLVRPLLFADKTMLYRYAEWHHIPLDRKSTRLNSSHVSISYAVFCLNKNMIIAFYYIITSVII